MASGAPARPYRDSDETPLEALVRRGPARLGLARHDLVRATGVRQLALVAVGTAALMAAIGLFRLYLPVLVLGGLFASQWYDSYRNERIRELYQHLRAHDLVVDRLEQWFAEPRGHGAVELVLAAASPLATRAVRVLAPDADVDERAAAIVVAWDLDLEARAGRLLDLLDVLVHHRDELGLQAVRCLGRPEPPVAPPPVEP